jgi:hypothetical protein
VGRFAGTGEGKQLKIYLKLSHCLIPIFTANAMSVMNNKIM